MANQRFTENLLISFQYWAVVVEVIDFRDIVPCNHGSDHGKRPSRYSNIKMNQHSKWMSSLLVLTDKETNLLSSHFMSIWVNWQSVKSSNMGEDGGRRIQHLYIPEVAGMQHYPQVRGRGHSCFWPTIGLRRTKGT